MLTWTDPKLLATATSGIPESGNGVPDVPDVLDEVRVELDWLLKMQLGDGSVLNEVHQASFDFRSPPSTDNETRYYHDPTLVSGAVLVGSTAIGARAFQAVDGAYSARLKAAAEASWAWLVQQGDSDLKVWAAAELFRLDPSNNSARAYVDGFSDWSQQWFELDTTEWRAAIAYVQTPGASASTVAGMRQRIDFHVDNVLSLGGTWRAGMQSWQYYWGSNRPRALYGLFLLQAAQTGSTGSSTPEAMRERALDYLHFLHGRNALGMLYLTNMSAFGGEHSSYQIFHGWFGNWSDQDSIARFVGKPAQVIEPDYPYFEGRDNHGVRDNKVVTLGPAPGFVPGGPNASYGPNGDESTPPANASYVDRAYRDWADQMVWTARTWEVTENSISYQGPYTALAHYFVTASGNGQSGPTEPCVPSASTVCLLSGRFAVTAKFRDQNGASGAMSLDLHSGNTALAHFGDVANLEMMIKVLDGCGLNQRYWVFAGGLTDQEIELRIEDRTNGAVRTWTNPVKAQFQPIQDTNAFTCDAP